MYSSTVSTASTIPIDDKWALSVSSQQEPSHPSEFFCPSDEFKGDFLKRVIEPIPVPKKKSLQKVNIKDPLFHELQSEQKSCIDEWTKWEFNKECEGWDSIRSHLRKEAKDRKQMVKNFLHLKEPWYIPPKESPKEPDPVNNYYCYPKICADLGHHFVHYKKIVEYIKSGIFIFLVDLRYGTEKSKLRTLKHIGKAELFCDSISTSGITVAIGFHLSDRILRTGIVKRNRDVFLDHESRVILTVNRKYSDRCSHRVIYVNFADFLKRMEKCDVIQIGERIKLQVEYILLQSLYCKVIQEGLLTSEMPVKFPVARTLEGIDITAEEEEDVLFAIKQKADFIVCPCVYKPHLIHYIRWLMASHQREVYTFAKIEMGCDILIRDVDLLLTEYRGIWLQDYPFRREQMFDYLIDKCFRSNKIIIRSLTFKCEDMKFDDEDKLLRQKLFMYADCISTPINARIGPMKMNNFIQKHYPEMNEDTLTFSCKYFLRDKSCMEQVFLRYAFYTALLEQVTCIILLNNSGNSVSAISRNRVLVPIIANLCDTPTTRSVMLLKNVYPLRHYEPICLTWVEELNSRLESSLCFAKNMGFIKRKEPFMVCYDSVRGIKYSDTFRVLYIE